VEGGITVPVQYRGHVLVCGGTGCTSNKSKLVQIAFAEELEKNKLDQEIKIVETGCHGFCEMGPLTIVYPEGTFYVRVKPDDVAEIVAEQLLKGRIVERLLYKAPVTEEQIPTYGEIPFYKKQKRNALRNCGTINPENIQESIARDGYEALAKVLYEMTPEQVIDEIKLSGLRGRGGGGFPTGMKWEFCRKSPGDLKYLICNADEGDPGAFMDRSVLEGDPNSVLEGMAIAAYAIGCREGYIYCRAEYPLAIKRLKIAIAQAEELGLLGDDILGTGFSLHLHIKEGAGAFVCGEETALMASIEGKRGMPRVRPPFPAVKGLWDKPSNINNVETFANVPQIILRGGSWFAGMGTEKSKGTKVFALVGKVNNTGLVEVPMGISLREIIFEIGGGIVGGKAYKGVQMGGPSGGCIPASMLDTPVDYESLIAAGAMMGSGGMVVMDETTCMVDLARFFLNFTQSESCGKCTPCREGTKRMLEILTRICAGKGVPEDLDTLDRLCRVIKATALCGLGNTAPNPVLSTMRYFRDEYEAHILDKHCPASVCSELVVSPCQNTCPAGIDVPLYVDLIKQKRFADAYLLIMRDNPLPSVCGRVCNHPCEQRCRRGTMDQPISIRVLKRSASDYVYQHGGVEVTPPPQSKEQSVGIIGAGPAGLSAAYYLARLGYGVTIYEALPVAGGMLAVGIPDYRLPRQVLDQDISLIQQLGVTIKTGVRIGKDITVEELKQQHAALFLAIGSHGNQPMGVPGEDLEGVLPGVAFLREVNLGQAPNLKDKVVAVVGGGNVAMDAARSSLRLGAKEVRVVYRRPREDMPAAEEEIDAAEHEGVKFTYLAAPLKVAGSEGHVTELVCQQMRQGDFDDSGRRRPVPVAGAELSFKVDLIIPAIGQVTEYDRIDSETGLSKSRRGTVNVDKRSMATNVDGIFSGGDCVTGPDTVVEAIAAGKKAAAAIDKYLGGKGQLYVTGPVVRKVEGVFATEGLRPHEAVIPVYQRLDNFSEVELGLTLEQAVAEAERCLRCDCKDAGGATSSPIAVAAR
jgi:NADH-quinone oxidoreductase subunit F